MIEKATLSKPFRLPGRLGRAPRFATGLIADRTASTALEFGLVVLPFIGLILAIFNTALVYFAEAGLETAAESTARVIMTGEAQKAGMTQAQFKSKACGALPPYMTCSNLFIDVQKYSTFSAATTSRPNLTFDGSGNVTTAFNYQMGLAGDIVVVRLMYLWPIGVANLGYDLSTGNGKRLMLASAVAKTEPYK